MLAQIVESVRAIPAITAKLQLRPRRLATAVIDDSPTFLEVTCALIERDEEVDVVARGRDGKEAIEIVAALDPDLVVMDIDMPQLDGLNAAMIIACCFPRTQVILMSAEDTPELRADSRACGAVGFISKTYFRQEFPWLLEEIAAR